MIIGLTGLHGAGKSYTGQLLEEVLGWKYFEKRAYLQALYENDQKVNSLLSWFEWHRKLYSTKGSLKVMQEILEKNFPMQKVLVIDAVHNAEEWRAIKDTDSRAILVGVFSPSPVRAIRRSPEEYLLDRKRITHWHESSNNNDDIICLLSEVEWAFTGMLPRDFLINQCKLLHSHLRETKRII